MTLNQLVKKHTRAIYGPWRLVNLPSGKWAAVWHACFEIEDLILAILTEDRTWFASQITFAAPITYGSEREALEEIITGLQTAVKRDPFLDDSYGPLLKKARKAHALTMLSPAKT